MRRKNRQIKMTLDIPEAFADDEAFMLALADRMDESNWTVKVLDDDDIEHTSAVSVIVLGDVSIEPEEEG